MGIMRLGVRDVGVFYFNESNNNGNEYYCYTYAVFWLYYFLPFTI